ncbi:MAG: glycosyltransferase family 4 protein [Flavobacteriales bacterium]
MLIIAYYWPPSGGAGVQRWLKFVKYLRDFGWEPLVYTAENAEYPVLDLSLEKDIPVGIEVIRRPIKEPYTYYKALLGQKKNDRVYSGFLQESGTRNWKQKLSLFIRANLFIPDARFLWIRPSVAYLKKYLKQNHVDLVISTGPPHSMHLIAEKVSKSNGLPWIADFRDPWTNIDFAEDLPYTAWAKKKNERLERKVLQNADAIVVVSELMSEEFRTKTNKPIHLITNGFDEDDFKRKSHDKISNSGKFKLIHTGSLNNRRNHSALWQAIQELILETPEFKKSIEISLVGKTDIDARNDIKKYGLESFTALIDYMPHEEVIHEQMQADILLLLINRFGENGDRFRSSKGTLTGKVFEYMACGKPILAIGEPDSHLGRILKETASGEVFHFDDVAGIKQFIIKVLNNPQGAVSMEKIKRFSRKSLTGEMTALMNQLSNKS